MSEKITIDIQLRPYLKEYIDCKFSLRYDERNNLVHAIIKPFIKRIPLNYKPKECEKNKVILTIEIPKHMRVETRDGKYYIPDESQKDIERIIYAHFKDALFSFIDDKIRYTNEIKKCILQFCSDNNITFDETNYETLKKAYYRSKEKKKEKKEKSFPKSFPNLSLIFLL